MKSMELNTLTRKVLFEKAPFLVRCENLRTGIGFEDIMVRNGYIRELGSYTLREWFREDGFYVIVSGGFIGKLISRKKCQRVLFF